MDPGAVLRRVCAGCGLGLLLAAPAAATAAASASAGEPRPLLISRQLAADLDLHAGDVVHLAADPEAGGGVPFRIVALFEPMPDPARLTAERLEVRLHLPDLLALTADPRDPLAAETIDTINVLLADPDDAEAFAADAAARVPGLVTRAAAAGSAGIFVVLERFHMAIAIVTVVASTVFLLALMIMLVDERRQLVGILRLIGLSRRRILVQVFVEGIVVAAAGTLFGLLVATASQVPINAFFQWRYDTPLVFVQITPSIAWRSAIVALPLGALASVAASWALLRRHVLVLVKR